MGKTSIEWTDASWNPIVGCTEVSPGCANCYAARLAATRLRNTSQYQDLATLGTHVRGQVDEGLTKGARWRDNVRFLPERLEEPLHWRKPRRIFVCDMGDLFHEETNIEWIDKVWDVMLRTPHHTYQILTKRARNLNAYLSSRMTGMECFLPNVWLGVSVENQHFADERIPLLLATPAAVRWISAEPLLGPVDISRFLEEDFTGDLLNGPCQKHAALDWVVCGGESGPQARPMHPDWARSLLHQCQAAKTGLPGPRQGEPGRSVPFFFKQWGEWIHVTQIEAAMTKKEIDALSRNTRCRANGPEIFFKVGKHRSGRLLGGRTWDEFPESAAKERANVSRQGELGANGSEFPR
jgi:protein gp37